MNYNPTYQELLQQYGRSPMQQQYGMPGTPPAYSGQILQVNGRAGAEALNMAPNSSIYVQDTTNGNRIFLCMTDGAGYKTVRGIIGTFEEEQERKQQESVILALESRIKALEDVVNGFTANHESVQNSGTTGISD